MTTVIQIMFCLLVSHSATLITAQEEYTWEMGGAVGGSFYMGDATNNTPFKNTGIAGGLLPGIY